LIGLKDHRNEDKFMHILRKSVLFCASTAFAISLAAAPDTAAPRAKLSAAEIVEKNVAARGGLRAWRAVETLSLAGKMGAGGNQRATLAVPIPDANGDKRQLQFAKRPAEEAQLPFLLELKRPHKQRLEVRFNGQTAIQVYDGTKGWKLRPFLNRNDVEPFTTEELNIASMQTELDGPLVDYAAKGTQVELAGVEKVEGRDTYELKLTLKTGRAIHVWIDAETFLETKMEGTPRRLDGTDHPVEVYFRDFRPVGGVRIPYILETKVLPVARNALGLRDTPVPVERITIEKVEVNPKLADALFAKPVMTIASNDK
jgi:outer membrane lipoprotein-sorting protein